ncbi:MAG TPA: hypothetical protein VFR24_14570 [Candidatus Angelobacter sp.]|nr:hypothetical protein [Candidatus Angelobacter sp.]
MSLKTLRENLKKFETESDVPPVPLEELAEDLRIIADELRVSYELDGFAQQLDELADRIEDRIELTKRKKRLEDNWPVNSQTGEPLPRNADQLVKATRRDRRFQEDMRLILAAGGTTYRGQKIYGTKQEPHTFRYTRQEVLSEFRGDFWNQLGRKKPS